MRGIDVAFVAEQTRIGASRLRALEAGDWDDFAAWVYVRGTVSSYARAIGLEPNDVLLKLQQSVEDVLDVSGESKLDRSNPIFKINSKHGRQRSSTSGSGVTIAIILVVTAVAAGVGLRVWPSRHILIPPVAPAASAQPGSAPAATTDMAKRVTAPASEIAAVPTADVEPAPGRASPAAEPDTRARHEVVLHALEQAWIQVEVDDAPMRDFTLPAGRRYVMQVAEFVTVYTGNAGGVLLLVDGEPQPVMGESGQVRRRTLRFSKPTKP